MWIRRGGDGSAAERGRGTGGERKRDERGVVSCAECVWDDGEGVRKRVETDVHVTGPGEPTTDTVYWSEMTISKELLRARADEPDDGPAG